MLVPINDYRDLDIDLIGEKAKKLNVSCVIYPDGCEPTREVGCLFFSHSEFMAVALSCMDYDEMDCSLFYRTMVIVIT